MVETVLMIDDDKATIFINKRIINRHNKFNNVVSALGGVEGLKYLKSIDKNDDKKPQLIFLDLNMPCMSGWDFIEEYKNLDQEIINGVKLIILTTSSDPKDISKSKKMDTVNGFINKPLSLLSLDKVYETHFKKPSKDFPNSIQAVL